MKSINIAVCDTNTSEANLLKRHLQYHLPNLQMHLYLNADLLLEDIQEQNPYRAIFLRMEPKGMNGIEVAKKIRKKDLYIPLIILCGSERYMKEAFDVYAWQYLVTPVKEKDVEHAILPLKLLWDNTKEKVLHYRSKSQIYTVPHNRILYIYSNLHTVNIRLTDGTSVHCRGKLDEFSEQLKDSTFVRCHQSFFVNMDFITSMKKDSFIINGDFVPISRSCFKETQEIYERYLKQR